MPKEMIIRRRLCTGARYVSHGEGGGPEIFLVTSSSDVRGNARGVKSGLRRTALQIPGLQPAAIVWAPEAERGKQWLEIWSRRCGLSVTQAWPILDDAIKYLVCESLMKLE